MRQIHTIEEEPIRKALFLNTSAALTPNQKGEVGPHHDILVKVEEAQSSTEELVLQCSRDTPQIEALNFLAHLSTPLLIFWFMALVGAGEGPLAVLTASSLVGINYSMRRAIRRCYAKDADEFAELGPESVGKLLDYIGWPNTRVEIVASLVLAQLLPTFTREQFEALPAIQRRGLYAWLKDGNSACAESKISLLRWLADVADAEAPGYIEQVARKFPYTPTQRRLRKEARSSLSQILDRLDKERSAAEANSPAQGLGLTGAAQLNEDDLETTKESRALLAQIRKHSEKRTSPGMRMGYLIANWCCITPYVAYKFCESISMHAGFTTSSAWFLLTAASTQLYRLSLTPAHTRMARQLSEMGDTHAIGALAEALEWPDEEIQIVARAALLRLLPKLTISDAPSLNSRQRRCLNNKLVLANSKNYLDSELQVKILQAWEKVGDLSSLPTVKSLASAKAVLINERKVQRAAVLCLPHLEERAHMNESSQILLRASSSTEAGSDTLVRPATGGATHDAELLRPGE